MQKENQNKSKSTTNPTVEGSMDTLKHIAYMIEATKNGWGLKSHGFIYEVIQCFKAKNTTPIYIKDGEVLKNNFKIADKLVYEEKYISKGSFIEFRYESDFCFRDETNNYYEIDSSVVAIKCIPFAKIDQSVRWNNQLNLSEILKQKKYTLMS